MATVIQLGKTESERALQRFVALHRKGLSAAEVREAMGDAQFNLAEHEITMRAGDPKRYDPETGNYNIWP